MWGSKGIAGDRGGADGAFGAGSDASHKSRGREISRAPFAPSRKVGDWGQGGSVGRPHSGAAAPR